MFFKLLGSLDDPPEGLGNPRPPPQGLTLLYTVKKVTSIFATNWKWAFLPFTPGAGRPEEGHSGEP